ncbi:hypothetical protein [Streptomyces sp. 6N223]|uniref:hypothetical protein n=1 Tax=Streptomyces sp. 6N223 TaxID=3457412 RepID=UPI003FD6B66D
MQNHRSQPTRSFSTYSNELLRDRRLSFCAIGVLVYLLSLPPQARPTIRTLAKQRREGRASIARALHELEECRYLKRVVSKDPQTGLFTTEYEVFDAPYDDRPDDRAQARDLASGAASAGDTGALPSGVKTRVQEPPSPPPPKPPPKPQRKPPREPVVVPEAARRDVNLLGSLGLAEPRLAMGVAEAAELAPLVRPWREAGVGDEALRVVLTAGLPDRVYSAVGLVRDRLRRKAPMRSRPEDERRPLGLSECERCQGPSRTPGLCRICRDGPPPEPDVSAFVEAGRRGIAKVRAALGQGSSRSSTSAMPSASLLPVTSSATATSSGCASAMATP